MKKNCICLLLASIAAFMISGCGKSGLDVPFTELSFESTMDDVVNLEGEEIKSYPSFYNGTTHVYEKDYMGNNGTIKYMTDRDDNLMSIAWAYTGETDEEVNLLYSRILEDLTKEYGKSVNGDGTNNNVEKWELEDGHILLTAVNTSDLKALQLAYISQAAADYKRENVEVDSVTVPLRDVVEE